MHSVGAQDKVLVELIANDRRDAAVDYIENWGNDARRFPTTATPEGVRIDLPLTEGLPDDVHLMSDRQLELISRVMRAVWSGDRLTVSGWAFIRNLDLAANPPEILVELVSADGAYADRPGDRVVPRAAARPDGRSLALRLPAGRLPRALDADQVPGDPDQDWAFEITMTAAGIRRTTRLRDVSSAGSSAVPQTHLEAVASPARPARARAQPTCSA